MNWPTLLLIAVGLAMDAFAVSVSAGVILHEVRWRHTFRVASCFGAFQAGMPVVGWLAGRSLRRWVAAVDHWVAFGLLAFIGVRMIADCLRRQEESRKVKALGAARMLTLSIATSIDALAVGVSIAMLGVNIWKAAAVIGVVTGALSALGMEMGDHLVGQKFGRKAELVGGLILCGIGLRILLEHLL